MERFEVKWNRYDGKFSCVIGYLEYEDIWKFYYDIEGACVASKIGFTSFPEFPNFSKTYESPRLFNTFDFRIRRSTKPIPEENKIELLLKTKAILATDNIVVEKSLEKSKIR